MLIAAAMLVIAVLLARDRGGRRLAAAGLTPIGLGLAAGALPGPVPAAPTAAGFLAVNAGLLVVGLLLVGAGLGVTARQPRDLVPASLVAGVLGLLLALWWVVPMAARAGVGRTLISGAVIAGAGAGVAWVGGLGRRWLRPRTATRLPLGTTAGPVPILVALLGVLSAGFGTHIPVVLGGAVLSGAAAWWAIPSADRPSPVAPVLTLVFLGAALWLLATIAGPEGLAISAVLLLPLSPAAERLIAPLLLGGAWALGGLWPLRQPLGGVLTAPAGALVLLRVGVPAVAAGLSHWRAAAFPVLLVGFWHASLTGRYTAMAVAGALLGVATLESPGIVGAGWLLAAAACLELARVYERNGSRRVPPAVFVALALAAGWGALGVAVAGLRTEVVYTVVAASGLAAGLGQRGRDAR